MTRQSKHTDSREGLLRTDHVQASRSSLDEAYRSSSDSDKRLDSLDLDAEDKSRQASRRNFSWFSSQPPWSSGYTYKDSQANTEKKALPKKGLERWLLPRKPCFLIALILALGLVTIVGSGALWVYNATPADGVGDLQIRIGIMLTYYP